MIFLQVVAVAVGLLIYWRTLKMSDAVNRLRADVQAQTAVVASAVALIGGIATQLRQAAGDEAAVNDLADQLEAQTTELAGAVAANTPAASETGGTGTGTDTTGAGAGEAAGTDTGGAEAGADAGATAGEDTAAEEEPPVE